MIKIHVFKCECGHVIELVDTESPILRSCPNCSLSDWSLVHTRSVPDRSAFFDEPVDVQSIELRPCPFCGGTATFADAPDGQGNDFTVGCSEPSCDVYVVAGPTATPTEAAEAWNHRA